MKLLLDTNLLLQAACGRLSQPARDLIEDEGNVLHYSAAAIGELLMRYAENSSALPVSPYRFEISLQSNGYQPLDITSAHVLATASLRDLEGCPLDRVMIAQASLENMVFVTTNPALANYGQMVQVVPPT